MRKEKRPMIETFIKLAIDSIDEQGIYPHHAMVESIKDEITVASMLVGPDDVYGNVKKMIDKTIDGVKQLVFGLDRSNMEGQDIDMKYHSVLTIAHLENAVWKIGAMPYASKEEVGEIQWNNKWWMTAVTKELKAFGLMDPSVDDEVVGKAYQEKISITSWRQTDMGKMFEGFINMDKVAGDVKMFIESNGLDINDRNSVIDKIKSLGYEFKFSNEDHGFTTLHADKGVFPARASRTKVYLEGLEHIAAEELSKKLTSI